MSRSGPTLLHLPVMHRHLYGPFDPGDPHGQRALQIVNSVPSPVSSDRTDEYLADDLWMHALIINYVSALGVPPGIS